MEFLVHHNVFRNVTRSSVQVSSKRQADVMGYTLNEVTGTQGTQGVGGGRKSERAAHMSTRSQAHINTLSQAYIHTHLRIHARTRIPVVCICIHRHAQNVLAHLSCRRCSCFTCSLAAKCTARSFVLILVSGLDTACMFGRTFCHFTCG